LKGNEALKIDLLSKIEKAGLTNKIKLMGFVNDIDSLLASADVCLIPSLMKDPFPTTVLEAMSAGKPIIATNHGGAVEAIRDGISGCLIEPNNPKQFAQTIRQLIENPALCNRLGKEAKADFETRFTLENFRQNWLQFQKNHELI
jgi:glycosyltransferase involved in cell wall biosynthesis